MTHRIRVVRHMSQRFRARVSLTFFLHTISPPMAATGGNSMLLRQSHPCFRSVPFEILRQLTTILPLAAALRALPVRHSSGGDFGNDEAGIRPAVVVCLLSFLTFSFLQTRDLVLTWPHPGFWRIVAGGCTFYALCLVVLLHLTRDAARSTLAAVFFDLGTQTDFDEGLRSRIDSVMGTCLLTPIALYRQIFVAPWVLAHSVGWTVKMLAIRNFSAAFLAACVFEIMEVTLLHAVPEFEECWWDSLFLDMLGANVLGMVLGDRINRSFAAMQQSRGAVGAIEGAAIVEADRDRGFAEAGCFAGGVELGKTLDWPGYSYEERANWRVRSSLVRLLQVIGAALFASLSDLNSFLLINALGIANNKSWAVLLRLTIVGLAWIPAGAEWYQYVEASEVSPRTARIGPSLWLLVCTTALELAVSIKFFPDHMAVELRREGNILWLPRHVLLSHLVSMLFLLVWIVKSYGVLCGGQDRRRNGDAKLLDAWGLFKYDPVDLLLLLAGLPIGFLFWRGWKFD